MTTARRALRTAAVSIVAVAWAAVALAAGGELDPSFSGDGWVRTLEVRSPPNTYPPRGGVDVALQSDGKILVTGEILDATSHWYFGVFRNTDDGSLDRSFAGGGLAETDLGEAEFAHAVAVQRNGRIVVAGEADCPSGSEIRSSPVVPVGSWSRGSIRPANREIGQPEIASANKRRRDV
jgi:uncharacterized delta-60 repeat protein